MRLLDRLTDRYSLRQAGYWEGMASGAAVLLGSYGDPAKEKAVANLVEAARDAYVTSGPVFACILVRLALFSEARFRFQSLVDKHLFGSEDLRILEEPWPNCTTGELLARMEQDLSLAGNAFLWKAADDRLVRLPPEQVTIISTELRGPRGAYREVVGYEWDPTPAQSYSPGQDNPSDKAVVLPVEEVAHWSPYPDPRASFRGMSWLTPVLREINADTAMTGYKIAYLENAASPNLLIKYQQKLRPDTIDAVAERMKAKYAGSNAFSTLVLDQGADTTVIGNNLDQMQFASTQEAGANRICGASGVDPILIGLLTLGRAAVTYEQAMRRLGDIVMRPLWRTVCAALQKLVPGVPDVGVRLWFDTADIAALRASETERAQTMQVSAAAVLTWVQAGFTRESAVAAMSAGDIGQLVPDPNAPPAGISGRETSTQRIPSGANQITDGNPSGEPPAPARKPGPPMGNGKGPTPQQMKSMPPALLRRPRA